MRPCRTEDVDKLTDSALRLGYPGLEHNYGLWFDRRRDAHDTRRRRGPHVKPPFLEQPWIDTIAEWEEETGKHVTIPVGAPKDVVDAILADPRHARVLDVLDLRYWRIRKDGSLAPPSGGKQIPGRRIAETRDRRLFSFRGVPAKHFADLPNRIIRLTLARSSAQLS